MAYNKNTWKNGDVVTSAKLNNIESGIANAVLTTSVDFETMYLSHTAGELYEAYMNGAYVHFIADAEDNGNNANYTLANARNSDGYLFYFTANTTITFHAATADDYPTYGDDT